MTMMKKSVRATPNASVLVMCPLNRIRWVRLRRVVEPKVKQLLKFQRQADLLERAKKEERDERNRLEEKTENNRRHNAAMAMVQSSNDQQATILNNVQKMVAL